MRFGSWVDENAKIGVVKWLAARIVPVRFAACKASLGLLDTPRADR